MAKRWYVVQSKVKHEQVAYEHLKNQRYAVFFPQIIETRKIRGREIFLSQPLFPSYLFVQFDIKRSKWRSILGTRGVQTLLGSTDIYASPLPKGFVEDLLKQADKRGNVPLKGANKVIARYKPGDQMRIKEGVFSGLSGTCDKIQEDFATIIMSLQSGNFQISLSLRSIEPA